MSNDLSIEREVFQAPIRQGDSEFFTTYDVKFTGLYHAPVGKVISVKINETVKEDVGVVGVERMVEVSFACPTVQLPKFIEAFSHYLYEYHDSYCDVDGITVTGLNKPLYQAAAVRLSAVYAVVDDDPEIEAVVEMDFETVRIEDIEIEPDTNDIDGCFLVRGLTDREEYLEPLEIMRKYESCQALLADEAGPVYIQLEKNHGYTQGLLGPFAWVRGIDNDGLNKIQLECCRVDTGLIEVFPIEMEVPGIMLITANGQVYDNWQAYNMLPETAETIRENIKDRKERNEQSQ